MYPFVDHHAAEDPDRRYPFPVERAILAPNHLSLLDGPVIARAWWKSGAWRGRAPLLFGVDPDYARHPVWRAVIAVICRIWRVDVVAMGPRCSYGLRRMLRHLEEGGVVCLFPAGAIGASDRFPGIDFLSRKSGADIRAVRLGYRVGRGRYALTGIECPPSGSFLQAPPGATGSIIDGSPSWRKANTDSAV
jgi:1-acyl-sn-glycerol-3-phosphate acyltransferase